MPRRARVHFVSLKSSLVNLPISIYGPLLERSIRPQHLAVHLISESQNGQKIEAYVGWTGMASSSSLAHFNSPDAKEKGFETIEIDPQYSQGLGFAQGDVVEIGLLHDLPLASTVATEPLTSDDWEIIEIHASHVESTLLSQVRVAKVGQEIDIWVLGRTRVRLKVVSVDPPSKNNALLLTTNTEVSIAPKSRGSSSRQQKQSAANGHALATSNQASTAKNDVLSEETKSKFAIQVVRVLPARVLPPLSPPSSSYTQSEPLAYVHPRTFATLTNSRFPLPADSEDVFHKITYRRLPPPLDPTSSASNPTEPASSPALEPRLLKPGDKSGSSPVEKVATDTLFVGWSKEVLYRHIVFPGGLQNVNDWDIIELSYLYLACRTDKGISFREIPPADFLAGVDEILKQGEEFCLANYAVQARKSDVRGISALLLTGRSGTGKTSIVRAIGKAMEENSLTYSYIHYVDFALLSTKPVQTLKSLFHYYFAIASWHRPSILIFDNIDKVLSAEVENVDSFRTRHITELFIALFSSSARQASQNFKAILMLATVESRSSLHPLLSTKHIFQEVVDVKPPNRDARKDIISRVIERRLAAAPSLKLSPDSPPDYTTVAIQTEGYCATDLHDLVSRAIHQAVMRLVEKNDKDNHETYLSMQDFNDAQVDFVPLSLRDVPLQKSTVEWADIGGTNNTKRIIRETLEWPTKYAVIFKQSPLRLRSGLLLYGYPGCGKTLLASAVARECGLNFISIKGPELLNKYIGASEKSVRDIFDRASAAKPCVLFFDEFDSIAPKRGHDSTGVTDRVVNQLLTQMDGVEGLDGVYVLAATSRPDLIDAALLRPGRLDKSVICDMPDLEDRKDILKAVSRKMILSPEVDLDEIALATDGYSGADLQALVYNAHLEVVHESLAENESSLNLNVSSASNQNQQRVEFAVVGGPEKEKNGGMTKAEEAALQRRLQRIKSAGDSKHTEKEQEKIEPKRHEITQAHLHRALKSTRPSVAKAEQQRLKKIYSAFVSDRSSGTKTFPAPPDPDGIGNRVSLM
ncbi:hypothetical protein SERLA73DRAFT_102940 [Serpula lacrymans var. lacrymans S7.3]|uniref:Peroxisomal ATPase PEX1 n=1 Tax=Serpula lacrymans var. lacrymans (strain S7.3) TaxID=936435 RepID=F8PMS0_SERL3|nr:hypothetical protein SERLA73DRAFT_102940 [Serpula lacrymans var. lacrymans S7.3]